MIFESGTSDKGAKRLYAQLASDYREILAAKDALKAGRSA